MQAGRVRKRPTFLPHRPPDEMAPQLVKAEEGGHSESWAISGPNLHTRARACTQQLGRWVGPAHAHRLFLAAGGEWQFISGHQEGNCPRLIPGVSPRPLHSIDPVP